MRRSLCGTVSVTLASLQTVLRLPAKRWAALNDELHEPDSQLARLTKKTAARLLARFGIGPYTTATLLIITATIQLGKVCKTRSQACYWLDIVPTGLLAFISGFSGPFSKWHSSIFPLFRAIFLFLDALIPAPLSVGAAPSTDSTAQTAF